MKSIGTKLALQIAVALILVIVAFGSVIIYQQRNNSIVFLQAKMERNLQQLSMILAAPLYNMNDDLVGRIMRSYLADPDILAIKITENKLVSKYLAISPETLDIVDLTQEESQPPEYVNAEIHQDNITYRDDILGTLEVVFFRQFVHAQTQQALISVGGSLLFVIIVESFVAVLLIRKNVSLPLLNLVQAARQIAIGSVDIRLKPVSSRDEIGTLTAAFDTMVTYIQTMAQIARSISNGDLRHEVSPRSDSDVLGHAFMNMTGYLHEIATVATAIANGNFRRDIQPKSPHDVLGNAFQQMQNLRQSIGEITNGAAQLNAASEKLNQISLQMASEAEEVSQQTQVVSSNSAQITDTANVVAVSAEQMLTSIREISQNTEKVTQVANMAVEMATSTAMIIADLETHSQEIGAIIEIITAVAQRTNLLALNARIEAARAQELGKGFTVVANEIKNLSRETASSTEDIIHKLEMIRSGSQQATESITKVSGIIKQIHDFADATAGGIEEQSVTTGEIARQITEAAQGSNDITLAITEVARAAQNTSEGVHNVQRAAQELASLAEQLQQSVGQFEI